MWLFLNNVFLSIVDKEAADKSTIGNSVRARGTHLLVRARKKGDIERVFGSLTKVQMTPKADYRYRAVIPREKVEAAMLQAIRSIDYGNFKDSVEDDDRHDAYAGVWEVMYAYQNQTGRFSSGHRK